VSSEPLENARQDHERGPARIRLSTAIRVCLIGLPIVIALASSLVQPEAITQHAVGGWTGALALILLCELAVRAVCAHKKDTDLLATLGLPRVAWSLALAVLAAIMVKHKPTLLFVLLGVGMLLAFLVSRESWDRRKPPRRPRSEGQSAEKSPCPVQLTTRVHTDGHEFRLRLRGQPGRLAGKLAHPRADTALAVTLTLVKVAIAMAVAGIAWSLGPGALKDIQGGSNKASPPTTTTPEHRVPPPTHTKSTPSELEAPVPTTAPQQNERCPQAPRNTVAEQPEAEIQELYTGTAVIDSKMIDSYPLPKHTGPAPGRFEAGCTKEYHEQVTPLGTFVWAWGQSPENGEVMSIAVDSKLYGPALFLSPAAQQVKRLIDNFGIVGGIRRYEAGTGDLYPVLTSVGTFLLVRREKSEEYSLLPPEVAQKWAQATKSARVFLWPVALPKGGWALYTDTNHSQLWTTLPEASWNTQEPELGEQELTEDTAKARKP
jgi:hypothetical protein